MATTTPNFGWPVPTSTDLVKDGATAIEALGDSIDASMLDLKGGTTGQVLSKTTNTDMDFTWVTSDDANAIQNTIVDAKGDLIAATAADTPARLAVGTNGQVLTADSTAATGLAWATASSAFVGCIAYASAVSTTFAANTAKIINLPSESVDTNSFHDNSTNNSRITIPSGKAGKYNFIFIFRYNGTTSNYSQIMIYKNGSLITSDGLSANGLTKTFPAGNTYQFGASVILDLAVADYIEFAIQQDSANTDAVTARAMAQYLGA